MNKSADAAHGDLLEESNMKNWQLQLNVAKVAHTLGKRFLACLTIIALTRGTYTHHGTSQQIHEMRPAQRNAVEGNGARCAVFGGVDGAWLGTKAFIKRSPCHGCLLIEFIHLSIDHLKMR